LLAFDNLIIGSFENVRSKGNSSDLLLSIFEDSFKAIVVYAWKSGRNVRL
jgi:hypothetical protein